MPRAEPERPLIEKITKNLRTGAVCSSTLETDDRVLARITDGIYRQPASAIRELIANAYDADATTVSIQTDIPSFNVISIRDDGNGMSINSLARLIYHIGGSAKRLSEGAAVGIVNEKDPTRSPNGRRLIGKIGIGLFSVSQLTRHFQIITKTRGTNYRLVADIVLKRYNEDDSTSTESSSGRHTGDVKIRSVAASDEQSHGTEVVLLDIRPQTRSLLQTQDLWQMLDVATEDGSGEFRGATRRPPRYHIGRYDSSGGIVLEPECLPWNKQDPPGIRFDKLFQAIVDEIDEGEPRPRLETAFDNYLRMLWTLSLSAPLDYVGKHPFDLTMADEPEVYKFDLSTSQATLLTLGSKETVRENLQLKTPERGPNMPFKVSVDDIELRRPIRFSGLPVTANAMKKPLIFVGMASPDLSHIPEQERGGNLSFEAYFLWTPKVVPTEHNGLLIRIADASGTLFDETFIKYQVAEQTRLRQLTAEVFVREGLDAALNIDRESFNYAHPHYQYLMKWVHRALRQFMTTHKQMSAKVREEIRVHEQEEYSSSLQKLVRNEYRRVVEVPSARPPNVLFAAANDRDSASNRRKGDLVFEASKVFAGVPETRRGGKSKEKARLEARMAALAQLLEAYGVFDGMSHDRQEDLMAAIASVLSNEGDTDGN